MYVGFQFCLEPNSKLIVTVPYRIYNYKQTLPKVVKETHGNGHEKSNVGNLKLSFRYSKIYACVGTHNVLRLFQTLTF